jgi:hypothetical protein
LCGKGSKTFKRPLSRFSRDDVESFGFTTIHDEMKALAPCLFDLRVRVNADLKKIDFNKRAQQRILTFAISVLANQTTQHFNAVQAPIGFFLFRSKVSKQVIAVLNKLGVCPSYNSILVALKAYDNLTLLARVANLRLFNQEKLVVLTCGYAVKPHPSKAHVYP